jgi:hypothetical protein
LVDYKNAFSAEKKIFDLLDRSTRLSKYELKLHHDDIYGIDVEATAPGYEEFAVEIESTQGSKWPTEAPYPVTWKKFSVPVRKKKFYDRHPMSLFVKVNRELTRAVVIPMVYVVAAGTENYKNQTDNHFTCNDFYVIFDPEHPALCFCKIEKLATVIDEQFQHLIKMKKANAKYTDMRPKFGPKPKELK